MEYNQNGIDYKFIYNTKNNEWFSSININNLLIELFIDNNLFDYLGFNWENVQFFTNHIFENINYIFHKSKNWTTFLYNDRSNSSELNLFNLEEISFENELAIKLNKQHHSNYYQYDVTSYMSPEKDPYCFYISKFDCQNGSPYFFGILREFK